MPFLDLKGLSLFGKISVESLITGPEYSASEIARVTSTSRTFGFNISSDDEQFIIGAYAAAKVFVYEFDGTNWNKAAEWTKTGRFGYKIAIDGEWAAIANTPTSGNGSVFIYRKVNGVWGTREIATINTPDAGLGSGFASSVSLSNGTLVIGHTKANTVGGAHVYVWDGNAWTKQGSLLTVPSVSTRAAGNQNLGIEVSLSNDTVVVGGSGDTLGKGSGLAFVSKRTGTTWSDPVVIAPETTYLDGYGWSVRARGNKVVVGAPYGNADDNIPGRVFLYDYSNSTPTLERIFTVKTDRSDLIQDTQMTTSDSFGWAIDLSPNGNVLAVGSINRFGNRGAVYVYEKLNNVWGVSALPDSRLTATVAAASNRFGSAVAFVQDGLVVGAYGLGAFYWFI